MRWIIAIAFLWLALLAGGAWAQEAGGGWLDVECRPHQGGRGRAGLGGAAWREAGEATPGGPAEAAGVLPGDVLVTLDGVEFENTTAFIAAISTKAAGTEVRLRFSAPARRSGWPSRWRRPAQLAAAKPKLRRMRPSRCSTPAGIWR